MKKYLLIAVATLLVSATNAQQLSTKKSSSDLTEVTNSQLPLPAQVKLDNLKTDVPMVATSAPVLADVSQLKAIDGKQISLDGVQLVAADNSGVSVASGSASKTGEVQDVYYATGYQSGSTKTTWTMYKGYDSSGNYYLGDVIPTIVSGSVLYAPYTVSDDGTTVTIEPTLVAYSSSYYIWLFDYSSSDGSIEFTLDDDGNLALSSSSDIIMYGAFPYGDTTFDKSNRQGYYSYYTTITYSLEKIDLEPTVCLEPEGLYLHASVSYSGYGYYNSFAFMPAYSDVNFLGFTEDADAYEWSVSALDYDSDLGYYEYDSTTGTSEDFTFITEPEYIYGPVSLTGANDTYSTTTYYGIGERIYDLDEDSFYAYPTLLYTSWTFSDGTYPLIGRYNYDRSLAYYGFLGTPDVNTQDYDFQSLIFYQGIPSAPLYIEGVNMLVYDYSPSDDGAELTCQLRKVTRGSTGYQTLGDIIAESTTFTYDYSALGCLTWSDFYVYDEDGMTEAVDYLFIEDEFAIIIDGWNNGTFSAYPYGEYVGPDLGLSTVSGYLNDGDGNYSLVYFPSLYNHLALGFTGVYYGFLYTEDSTSYNFSADGGTYSMNIMPYYCSNDGSGNYTTALYYDADTEVPDWLSFSIADEDYSSSWEFTLAVTADENTDEDSRSATVRLYQKGAYLDITVTQDGTSTDGITAVEATATLSDGTTYNLAGQRVSADSKGVVVSDGKKYINK